ncbi:glycosyltransferase [Microbacterium esteraromaticum]|nr:glycosyltransferase [Microbacterium esteraromaticum]
MRNPLSAIAVVIPVHDEEALLGACLSSVCDAAEAARAAVSDVVVHVVLDACTDASTQIAAEFPVAVHTVDACSVGVARGAGVQAALRQLARVPADRLWLAHTDADSAVPRHWLTHQVALANDGADVVVGTVRPDFRDLSDAQIAAWRARYTPGVANGHVHGANLGTRASSLIAVGGFPPIPAHEDVRLVEEMRRGGAKIVASDDAWVLTSGRQYGRATGGYADYLRTQLV